MRMIITCSSEAVKSRLRADFDISGYPQQARVILQAMKTYGLIVADN